MGILANPKAILGEFMLTRGEPADLSAQGCESFSAWACGVWYVASGLGAVYAEYTGVGQAMASIALPCAMWHGSIIAGRLCGALEHNGRIGAFSPNARLQALTIHSLAFICWQFLFWQGR